MLSYAHHFPLLKKVMALTPTMHLYLNKSKQISKKKTLQNEFKKLFLAENIINWRNIDNQQAITNYKQLL